MTNASTGSSLLFFLLCCACQNTVEKVTIENSEAWIVTATGLQYQVIEMGRGPQAENGMTALIHEVTQLKNRTIITDTWAMNFPIRFELGADQVIDGMEEAVLDMRVGERRKLIVPPSLSHRSSYPNNGLFGPEDTLYYDVILLKVEDN